MSREMLSRYGVWIALVGMTISLAVYGVTLSASYGALSERVDNNRRDVDEVKGSLPEIQRDLKTLIRAVGRMEGKRNGTR